MVRMYALFFVGFLAIHSGYGMSERVREYFLKKMREYEIENDLVCELKENWKGPYFQCRTKGPTFEEQIAKVREDAREYERRTGYVCTVTVDYVNKSWRRVCRESEAQQKERWRQAYLRALEKYKQETRAFEQRNDVVCEILEYPEEYRMGRRCWSIGVGRRSGQESTDAQTVPRDTTKMLRTVLTSN